MVFREDTVSIMVGVEGMSGGGSKRCCSSANTSSTVRPILSRPAALMGDLVAPGQSLAIAFGERGEGSSGPERIAHIPNSSFYASFLVSGAGLTRPCGEVIVRAQFEQARMEQDLIAATLQHG